jgi:DNA-binding transcriptional MerR regulator
VLVRFYERRGLVVPSARTGGGYREYAPEAVKRLKFIRRAQSLGFTLAEIDQLLVLSAAPVDVTELDGVIEEKVGEIEERMRDLDRVRLALLDVAANGPREACPVVAALS